MGNPYVDKIREYIAAHQIEAEHLVFEQSCHSVAEAAEAAGAQPDDFIKNICMITADGRLLVAIVKGEDRVSPANVSALGSANKERKENR